MSAPIKIFPPTHDTSVKANRCSSQTKPELQLILQICEDSGHLDEGGDIKELNDKVHEHYVDYLCSQRL